MKRWLWILLFMTGCKKKSGGGEAEYEKQMYKAMHDALVAPARRGPAFATMPVPPAPAKGAAPGPAYFLLRDVGLVSFNVDGTIAQQRIPLERRGQLALSPDGTPIVGAAHIMRVSG